MSRQYDKQFKEDAVKYYLERREPGLLKCAGNYSGDEAKETAGPKGELRDTQDALEILGVSRSGYYSLKNSSGNEEETL